VKLNRNFASSSKKILHPNLSFKFYQLGKFAFKFKPLRKTKALINLPHATKASFLNLRHKLVCDACYCQFVNLCYIRKILTTANKNGNFAINKSIYLIFSHIKWSNGLHLAVNGRLTYIAYDRAITYGES
jgi:hypothetical protein